MRRRQGLIFIGGILVLGILFLTEKAIHSKDESSITFSSISPEQEAAQAGTKEKNNAQVAKGIAIKNVTQNFQPNSPVQIQTRKIPVIRNVNTIPTQNPNPDELRELSIKKLNSNWHWWTKTTAVHRSLYLGSMSDSIGEVEGRIVVEDQTVKSSPNEFYPETPLVLYNKNRKSIALLTGVFIVNARTTKDFTSLEADNQFEVINSFSDLKLVFLKPKQIPYNINELAEALLNDDRVESFEFEILKGNLVKN